MQQFSTRIQWLSIPPDEREFPMRFYELLQKYLTQYSAGLIGLEPHFIV